MTNEVRKEKMSCAASMLCMMYSNELINKRAFNVFDFILSEFELKDRENK